MENFEKDVEAAFRQMKREQLKAMLQQTERELTEESKTVVKPMFWSRQYAQKRQAPAAQHSMNTVVKPMFRWWQYAAAACVVLAIGFVIYTLNLAPSNNEQAVLPTLEEPKTPKNQTLPPTKPTEQLISSQSFTFDIKESQSLGYGEGKAKKLKVEFVQDKSLGKGIVSYQLSKGKLMLKANQLPKIQSVVSYNDTLYLHFSNQFFKLTDNKYLKKLKPESDPVVIQELEKINFE